MKARVENIFARFSDRDKRAVKIAAVIIAIFVLYVFIIEPWIRNWSHTRSVLADERGKLVLIGAIGESGSQAKRLGLLKAVPVADIPQSEGTQRRVFREKFTAQLKAAGMKVSSGPDFASTGRKRTAGYKVLKLSCRGQSKYDQLLSLLAKMDENPHFVGIEEIKLQCDEKKRNEIKFNLTVSTFAK